MKSGCNGYGRALVVLCAAVGLSVLYSCASIGTPSGGPRDEDAPRVLRSSPASGSTGFKGSRVYVEFDELVNVKDAFTNVIVSPPQASVPKVTASGRRVMVEWSDPLLKDTTYTIDFGMSIEDVNEGNKLGNYNLSFSTGATIDTLRISGIVLDAATLEPQQGMLVGVHGVAAPDSALRALRFERVTKTDDRGRFTLRGLKAVPYRLYALGDLNNDYRRDNPAEIMAFYPEPITPYSEPGVASDTIYNLLTGAVDTVISRGRTVFLPNDILLSSFDQGYKPQYLVKYERPDSARLQFIFNARAAALPVLEFLGHGAAEGRAIAEYSQYRDTVTYWLSDRSLVMADTLRLALSFPRTDPDSGLVAGTDTLMLTKPKVKPQTSKKKNKKQLEADSIAREKGKWIALSAYPSGKADIFSKLIVESPEPIVSMDTSMMRLELKVDSLYTPLKMPSLIPDSTGKVRRYRLDYPWEYGASYRLSIDSTAMTGLTGRHNATLKHDFSVKKREDYASLTLRITPSDVQGYVEVLNSGDMPVARARVSNGIVRFPHLMPVDYYARFVKRPLPVSPVSGNDSLPSDSLPVPEDLLEFHTGDYDTKTQPDEVYYYPKVLSLKRHDRSEQWDLNGVAVDMQKPLAIKKNKPQTKVVSGKRKKGDRDERPEGEEEEYFDVNNNPFDPNSRRNRSSESMSY